MLNRVPLLSGHPLGRGPTTVEEVGELDVEVELMEEGSIEDVELYINVEDEIDIDIDVEEVTFKTLLVELTTSVTVVIPGTTVVTKAVVVAVPKTPSSSVWATLMEVRL